MDLVLEPIEIVVEIGAIAGVNLLESSAAVMVSNPVALVDVTPQITQVEVGNPDAALQIFTGLPGRDGERGTPGSGTSWIETIVTAPNFTILADDCTNYQSLDCTLGDQTIQLPNPARWAGQELMIHRVNGGPNLQKIYDDLGNFLWDLFQAGETLLVTATGNTPTWRIS